MHRRYFILANKRISSIRRIFEKAKPDTPAVLPAIHPCAERGPHISARTVLEQLYEVCLQDALRARSVLLDMLLHLSV